MRPPLRFGTSLGFGLAFFLFLSELAAQPPNAGDEFFEKEVRPLLAEKCAGCHGGTQPKGGLKLTSRADLLRGGDSGPAVVPGKPDESLLLKAVRYQDELRMPPKGKLTDQQIEVLERWVKQGAPWPGAKDATAAKVGQFTLTEQQRRFWSFQPVKVGLPPAVRDSAWPRSDIDRFILAKLEANGLAPAAPADKRTLLRRATFDLIGLPPTPAEIDAFLADDSPQAFARVVDRLLASPQYGERWGRHWLDVVRYADARDLIQLPPESDFREAWRYRDWVVESFNRDLPYPDFVRSSGGRRPVAAGPPWRHQQGRADRHGPAGDRRLRARRCRQESDDRRLRQRSGRCRQPLVPGPLGGLCPLPRPQVRPDLDRRLLRPGRHLLQHPASFPARCPATRRWSACRCFRRPRSPKSRRKLRPMHADGRNSNRLCRTPSTANIGRI